MELSPEEGAGTIDRWLAEWCDHRPGAWARHMPKDPEGRPYLPPMIGVCLAAYGRFAEVRIDGSRGISRRDLYRALDDMLAEWEPPGTA
jgi:hypothetical protein